MTELGKILEQWDVVVVGGGPAGSAAAITAAKDGLQVLQVDAKPFPRRKVCGGCLNQVSISLLKELVGEDSPIFDDAPQLTRFRLMDRRRQFEFATPTGLVVERSKLDNYLVEVGKQHGVTFLSPVTATLGETTSAGRLVDFKSGSINKTVCAKVVVLATGLGRQRGAAEAFQQVPHSKSRVGVEALVNCTADAFNEGTIYMSIGQDGYAGLTKVSDSKMHIAAAVDRESLRDLGPQAIVQRILDETGQRKSFDDLSDDISWRGTPALTTCAKQLAGDRVLLVGDAANYVEPFTGEGILWALKSGIGVAPLLADAVSGWDDAITTRWEAWHKTNIQKQQWLCRHITFGLKHAWLRWLAHQALRFRPGIARAVIRRLNGSP